ncbi:MAG: FAD-dependent oxidoreductase [Desulfobulbaceae bacterium]|nr:FAD-dependent oxidoreductase [Desulfobulbaceae bacterium]
MNKILVIGGSAAGAKAAARAKRMDESAQVTIIQKDPDLSMATCGYPYYVGGVFDNRAALISAPFGVVRDADYFQNNKGVTALVSTEATAIDPDKKVVRCRSVQGGDEREIPYDKLILAMGANANIPPIPGREAKGITTLTSMADTDYLRRIRDEKKVRQVVVVGGGLIGVEVCEALQHSGIQVTLIEALDQILPFLDWQLAKLVEQHMQSQGVEVICGVGVQEFLTANGAVSGVRLQDGREIPCGAAVLAVGVQPNTALAKDAGLELGDFSGIRVNEYMQSSNPDIYAAGDCVEIPSLLTGKPVFAPMGDLANLQGRVAGENASLGKRATFPGTIHSGICKVFAFQAGSTGMSEKMAQKAGIQGYTAVINASPDKPGFMGAKPLISKMLVDADQRITGYQCVGPGDVSRQIATAAMAIQGKLKVAELVNSDLPYAPPFSLAIDHFIAAAHIMQNKLAGLYKSISAQEVWRMVQRGEKAHLFDGRTEPEFQEMRLGIGEKLLPIGQLRARLSELPQDKNAPIIYFCKVSMRGYESARVLAANGYTNVRVMEGGLMAWPYPREK